jgi:hypothetical protein
MNKYGTDKEKERERTNMEQKNKDFDKYELL